MNYKEARNRIAEKNRLGSVLGLERIRKLLHQLGEPQNHLQVVHVAGTNGKGSTLAFIHAVLRHAGYRVGRYISPTVFCYLERFQIDERMMTEGEFADYMNRIQPHVEKVEAETEKPLTAFEIETAIAFWFLYEKKAGVMLLETGMGGRQDATNVVDAPLCTILTSIGLDHVGILGTTISEIAYEKTGILRDKVPCVVYPFNEEAMPVIKEQCSLHNTSMIVPDLNQLTIKSETLEEEIFDYKNVEYHIGILGKHQIYNAITAIEALLAIKGKLKNGLKKVNIQEGLHNADWKGRFEILERHPYVIRDGAHNPDAAQCLYEQLIKHFTNRRIIYIIGVLEDKDHHAMLSLLLPLADRVYVLTVPDNTRAMQAQALAEEVRAFGKQALIADTPETAYRLAKEEARQEDVILAFGSLYYIGRIGDRDGTDRQNHDA